MSAPKVIAELVITGIKVLGKATAAAGGQAVKNFKHKPEGAPDSAPVGGNGKNRITSQLQMSLEEARLILNVKKEDSMEVIQKNYDSIFKANGPPPPSAEPVKPTTPSKGPAAKKAKGPTHSHYLQSKVYRALERIKAEKEIAEKEAGAVQAELANIAKGEGPNTGAQAGEGPAGGPGGAERR